MLKSFEKILQNLRNNSVQVKESGAYPEAGQASVVLTFSEGTELRGDYWRMIKNGEVFISSFDHNQKYGLPAAIDAISELKNTLQEKLLTEARHDKETGDLLIEFTGDVKLPVLNFTGYEIWEIHFPDGVGEYSNYAK